MALGIITTLGALAAFLPFSAFLVGKTIWEYFIVKKKKISIAQTQEPADLNNVSNDELLSKADDLLTKNIDPKFPPTEQ
jgi:hypothetical protein